MDRQPAGGMLVDYDSPMFGCRCGRIPLRESRLDECAELGREIGQYSDDIHRQ